MSANIECRDSSRSSKLNELSWVKLIFLFGQPAPGDEAEAEVALSLVSHGKLPKQVHKFHLQNSVVIADSSEVELRPKFAIFPFTKSQLDRGNCRRDDSSGELEGG